MNSQKVVTPVKTGVQMVCNYLKELDSGFRRNDEKAVFFDFLRVHHGWVFFSLDSSRTNLSAACLSRLRRRQVPAQAGKFVHATHLELCFQSLS